MEEAIEKSQLKQYSAISVPANSLFLHERVTYLMKNHQICFMKKFAR